MLLNRRKIGFGKATMIAAAVMMVVAVPFAGQQISSTSVNAGECRSHGDVIVKNQQPLYSKILNNGANVKTDKIAVKNLRAGEYTVNYTSFDAHSDHGDQNQNREQWFFKVYAGDKVIAQSDVTKDVLKNVDYRVDSLDSTINLPQNATHIQFFHAAPNSHTPESVYPTCVGFDRVTPPAVQECQSTGANLLVRAGDHLVVGRKVVSGRYDINLPAGTYDANYTSFDGHSDHGDQNQNREQWHVELYAGDKLVYTTEPTKDIAADTDYRIDSFKQFKLNQAVDGMVIKHSFPNSNTPESVYATCVGFDLVSQPHLACKDINVQTIDRDSRKFTANVKSQDVSGVTYTFFINGKEVQAGSSNMYVADNLPHGNHTVKFVVDSDQTKPSTCETEFNVEAPENASLGDFVWVDSNKNGIQDAGEAGISGVVVTLLDQSGTVVATDVTDASGKYLFTGLAAGKYSVNFAQPDGYTFTTANSGDDEARDSDANPANGNTGLVMVGVSQNVRTVDAGVVPNPVAVCNALNVISATRDLVELAVDYNVEHVDAVSFDWSVAYAGGGASSERSDAATFSFEPVTFGTVNATVVVVADDIRSTCEARINLDAEIDLSVKKYVDVNGFKDADTAADAPVVTVGDTIDWKVVVTNEGRDAATGVVVSVVPPSGAVYDSTVSIADGQGFDAATGEWTVGTIAAGASYELVIRTEITDAGQQTCWAGVTAANEADVDSTPKDLIDGNEDDEDPAIIKVTEPQVLAVPPVVIPNTGAGTNVAFMIAGISMFAFATRYGMLKTSARF